jgi:hypothetical protein
MRICICLAFLLLATPADAKGALPFQPGRYSDSGCRDTSAASNHFLKGSHFSSSNDDCAIVGLTKVGAVFGAKMACSFTSGGGVRIVRDFTPISPTSFRFSGNDEGMVFSSVYRHCGA